MRIPFKLTLYRFFWRLRTLSIKLRFNLRRKSYSLQKYYALEKERKASTLNQVRIIAWSIFRVFLAILFLYLIEFFTNLLWQTYHTEFKWFSEIGKVLPKPSYPNDLDNVTQLISIIASVSGVILALFYPVLATIASTAYAKVHSSIRNLLLSEEDTQAYLRRLTNLTAISILVLLFISLGFNPGTLVLSFLVLYSLLVLFGILKIGLGIYRYFEPSSLITIVANNLKNIINNVTIKGEYWNDKNFQDFYYKQAFEQCENLSLINNLILSEKDIKKTSYGTSMFYSFSLLEYYLRRKKEIPIDSLWFPKVNSYPSYFESDMTMRQLSQNTRTYVLPKQKQDYDWFEEIFIRSLAERIRSLMKGQNLSIISDSIVLSYSIIDLLSSTFNTSITENLFNEYKRNIFLLSDKNKSLNYEDWKNELICIQSYVFAIQRFQVGIYQNILKNNTETLRNEFQKIIWNKTNSIYKTDLIPELIEQINIFRNNILNEISIEGKRITPDWYIQQVLASVYMQRTNKCLEETAEYFWVFIVSLAEYFDKEGNSLLASFTAHLSFEAIFKLQNLTSRLPQYFQNIDELQKVPGETPWKKPDVKKIIQKFDLHEETCLLIISKNIVSLSKLNWVDEYPDVFAHSYSLITQELNRCFLNNDINGFEKYFPSFLEAALTSFNHLNKIFYKYPRPYDISSQVIIDLLQISGLSYIYSYIHNEPRYWDIIKEFWDKHFDPLPNNFKFILSVYSYCRNITFFTPPNFHEEHVRHMTLSEVIKDKNLTKRDVKDPWVQHFIQDSIIPSIHPDELFIELYLFTFVDAKPFLSLVKRDLFEFITYNNKHINDYL